MKFNKETRDIVIDFCNKASNIESNFKDVNGIASPVICEWRTLLKLACDDLIESVAQLVSE